VNKNRLCFSCGECTLDEFCKERNKKRLWLFEK
jgi:RIO-like serine/threonine protein kinase